jgi:phage protein U
MPQREQSFQDLLVVPSAVLADVPPLIVPLYAVTTMTLSESYHLPPIGSSQQRMIVAAHDDTITLSGLLIGPTRFTLKFMLETMADLSKRGTTIERVTRGKVSGLVLVTAMTIRTDMQIQSLTFTASAAKRAALDVSMTLVHVPRPGVLSKVLDIAGLGVGALADFAR